MGCPAPLPAAPVRRTGTAAGTGSRDLVKWMVPGLILAAKQRSENRHEEPGNRERGRG
jgi:hypothetical protein